jgi:fumarate reductase subunit D
MSEPTVPPPPSYTPPPPPVGGPPPGAANSNRSLMLVLAYLGPLAVIPLVTEKNDPEVQWHAKHGLVLFVAEIILFFALGILHFIPFLGWILGCLLTLVLPIAILVLHVLCIVKAQKGERLLIPGLSEFADRF